jgi:hypothetical protein
MSSHQTWLPSSTCSVRNKSKRSSSSSKSRIRLTRILGRRRLQRLKRTLQHLFYSSTSSLAFNPSIRGRLRAQTNQVPAIEPLKTKVHPDRLSPKSIRRRRRVIQRSSKKRKLMETFHNVRYPNRSQPSTCTA